MSETMDTPNEQPETPATEPAPTLSLAEQIRKIIAESPASIPFAKVKSLLKAAGVKVGGKSGASDEEIQRELDSEGIHAHPAPKPDGKPKFWHSKHVTAEEKAAAKVAEVERKKAEKAAAAESKKAEAAAEKVRIATEKAELAQKKKDDAAAEKKRIADEKEELAQKKKDDAAAEKARIAAEKEAEKAKVEAEATQQRIAAIGETVRSKVEALGTKVVSPDQLFKFTAKHGDAEKSEFERLLKQLVEDQKLFEHPGGKFGLSAPLPWFEKYQGQLDGLVKAARKLTANDVPLEEVIEKLREKVGGSDEANEGVDKKLDA
jgi:hypothetical protein